MYFPEPDLNLRNVFFYIPCRLIFLSATVSTLITKQKSHRKVTSFRESLEEKVKSGPWRILYNTVATQSITERHKESTLNNIVPFSTIIASIHTHKTQTCWAINIMKGPVCFNDTATYSQQLLANIEAIQWLKIRL